MRKQVAVVVAGIVRVAEDIVAASEVAEQASVAGQSFELVAGAQAGVAVVVAAESFALVVAGCLGRSDP